MRRFLHYLFGLGKKVEKPRSCPRRDRRVSLNVDVLEDRMTPSINWGGGTVSVVLNSNAEAQGHNTITLTEISSQNPGVKIIVQDSQGHVEQAQFAPGTIDTVLLGGSQYGNDTYMVNGIAGGVTAYIDEASGPSVVNVTLPTESLDFLHGELDIRSGTPTLNIYDQDAASNSLIYTITDQYMTRTSPWDVGTIRFGNSSAVNIYGAYGYGGSGSNVYLVYNTPGWGTTTTLTTGHYSDTVQVFATSGQFNVHGEGPLTVNLGIGGSMQNTKGTVVLDNPPNWTRLNVDDSADPTGRTVDLYGSWGWGYIGGLAGGSAYVEYKYADTSSVTINTGTGANTINVWATGVTTNLVGHNSTYLDHVNIGFEGSLQYIQGDVNISNPPGYTVINVDDSADQYARNASLGQSSFSSSWGTLSGLAPANINYDYFDTYGLSIETNQASNVWVFSDGGVDTWVNGHPA
jgi:hypothetical protein